MEKYTREQVNSFINEMEALKDDVWGVNQNTYIELYNVITSLEGELKYHNDYPCNVRVWISYVEEQE